MEKPREITTLEGENKPTRTLHLKGLGEQAGQIFKEKGLTDEEEWSELIALYQGHPSWLNIIASTILELFDVNVARFLADGNDIYLGDIEPLRISTRAFIGIRTKGERMVGKSR